MNIERIGFSLEVIDSNTIAESGNLYEFEDLITSPQVDDRNDDIQSKTNVLSGAITFNWVGEEERVFEEEMRKKVTTSHTGITSIHSEPLACFMAFAVVLIIACLLIYFIYLINILA